MRFRQLAATRRWRLGCHPPHRKIRHRRLSLWKRRGEEGEGGRTQTDPKLKKLELENGWQVNACSGRERAACELVSAWDGRGSAW